MRCVLSTRDEDDVFAGADHVKNFMTRYGKVNCIFTLLFINIILFKLRFEAIPEIAKYLATRRKYPVFAERAFAGSD